MIGKTMRFISVLSLGVFMGSCLSFYCPGQLGHEIIPVPVPYIDGRTAPFTDVSFSLEADGISSIFLVGDGALNGQASFLLSVVFPFGGDWAAQTAVGISGWGGVVALMYHSGGYEYGIYRHLDSSDIFPYYGGSSALAFSLDRITSENAVGFGVEALASYETGSYKDKRISMENDSGEDSDILSWRYVNLSVSGLSLTCTGFGRFRFTIGSNNFIGFGLHVGFAFPDVVEAWTDYAVWVPVYGLTASCGSDRFTWYASLEMLWLLNYSISVGFVTHLF